MNPEYSSQSAKFTSEATSAAANSRKGGPLSRPAGGNFQQSKRNLNGAKDRFYDKNVQPAGAKVPPTTR
jgi:hypothetical protein